MLLNKKPELEHKIFYWIKIDYNFDVDLFYFENTDKFEKAEIVIVETKHGYETGKILYKSIPLDLYTNGENEYGKIVRKATQEDIEIRTQNINKVSESFRIANEKIKEHKLPLKLLHIHHFLDDKKIMFYFYCENRVDFRALVRDLAFIFKVRIELRQVGVRDEAMFIGGYGICGRAYCCSLIGTNKDPKSIKMAREQNLTLNSMRISGVCGRLLCCLDFEYDYYHEINFKYITEGTEILLNNETNSKVISLDKDKRIVTLAVSPDNTKISIPLESIIVNQKSGKCYAYI